MRAKIRWVPLAAMMGLMPVAVAADTFESIDIDGDGQLSFLELELALGYAAPATLARYDANGDGVLTNTEVSAQNRKPVATTLAANQTGPGKSNAGGNGNGKGNAGGNGGGNGGDKGGGNDDKGGGKK